MTFWHQTPAAQSLLHSLTEQDICLSLVRHVIGNDTYRWAAASEHGALTMERLEDIRRAAIEAHDLNVVWQDQTLPSDVCNNALTDLINAVPPVAAAMSTLYGSPDDWFYRSRDPFKATAMWRATFADKVELAA
jgi:hypothetical protein